MAEIYVLGRGEMPGAGEDSDGNPSGKFTKAVAEVFRLSGISARPRAPASRAVKWLKENDSKEFKRLMNLRATGGRQLSLLTGDISLFLRN